MKKMMFTLMTLLTITLSASAMSYEQARNEALFLTDKMAYELNLSDAQYEAAYEINLDYLMGVATYDDVFGSYWERRNRDLSFVLFSWQWDLFRAATYFYRPLYWEAGYWHFGIYARYPRRDYFYFGRPHFYASYRGGHGWHHYRDRSYYEGRRDHYRPDINRDRHFGMRDGWNRGDYRSGRNSSTRVTGPNNRNDNGVRNGVNEGVRGGNNNGRSTNNGWQNGNTRPGNSNGNMQGGNGRSSGNFRSGNAIGTTPRTNSNATIRQTTPRSNSVSIDRSASRPSMQHSSAAPTRSSSASQAPSSSSSRSSAGSSRGSIGGRQRR